MTLHQPADIFFPEPLQVLFRPKRYKVLYGGRGAGRSWGVARALLILGTKSPIRVLCARELQNSIEESVHKVLCDQIVNLGLGQFYDIQQKEIRGANGTTFNFAGIKNNTNKIRSYEGIDYCWVEEANKVSKASWNILTPTIRKKGSEIWITFNPELNTDYTFQRFVKESASDPDVAVVKMTFRDNPWFKDTELSSDMARDKEHDYDMYLNVWEGHTVQHLEGAIYARELRKAQAEGRICTVGYDQETPVDTFWDLGRADSTAIWFAQRVAMQYRVLAYYESSGIKIPMDDPTGGVNHFLKECQRRGYVYGTMWLPHDAKAKRLGSKRSVEEIIRHAGYRVQIVPRLSRDDGINAARVIFPNCWFDEDNCEDGINALRHYRYKVKDGQLSSEPFHDWASDGADAFRYLAVALKSPRERQDVISKLQRKASRVLHELGRPSASQNWMG
jgi:phage terminase large subunit